MKLKVSYLAVMRDYTEMFQVTSYLNGYCYRVLAEQAERAMKDQQTLLEHKESELRSAEEHVRLLEEQVSSLKRITEADREELAKLRATVSELDREKDELQMAVDEKTEQEASQMDAVAARVSAVQHWINYLPEVTRLLITNYIFSL